MRIYLLLLTIFGFLFLSCTVFAQSIAASTQNTLPPSASVSTAKKVAASVAKATDQSNPSTQQIESTVHQYLMKKPEVIVEALQVYQQKQMESMQQLFKDTQNLAPKYVDVIFHQDLDPIGGNSKGKISIVEFSDYQCSHCIEIAPIIDALIKANPNLRVVVKEFPIRGGVSEVAARAALAANRQGKYWEFRDALFKNGATLTQDKIMELAKSFALNLDQLKKDMDDAAIRKQVEANQKLAQTLKLVGTPAFFIAKTDIKMGAPSSSINYIPGVATQQQLQAIIDQFNH